MEPNDSSKKYFDIAKPRSAPAASGTTPIFNKPKRQMINIEDGEKPPEESQPISNIDDENTPYDDTLMDQPEASEPSIKSLSHPELVLPSDDKNEDQSTEAKDNIDEPKGDDVQKSDEDMPFVNPLPGTIEEEKPPEEMADEPKPEEEKLSQEEPKTDKSAGEKVVKPLEDSGNNEEPAEEKPQPDTPAPPPERFSAIDALPEDKEPAEDAKENIQDPTIYDTKEYYVPIGNTHHSHGGLKMAFAFGLLCAVIVVGAIVLYMLNFAE